MRSSALALLFATVASAQVANYTSSLNMTIDPNTVDLTKRATWCKGEHDTCGILCDGNASVNDCTVDDLKYECKCASNDSAPGLQYYESTAPTYICFELFDRCNAQYVGDKESQDLCITNIRDLCGTIPRKSAKSNNSDDDDDDEDNDDNDDDSDTSSTTTQAPSSSATASPSSDSTMTTSPSDGFAAPTMAPGSGAAAAAALGLMAYLI